MSEEYGGTTSELFSLAERSINLASLSAGRIGAGNTNLDEVGFSFTPSKRPATTAPVFSDLFSGVDNTQSNISELNDQVDRWLGKYFPAINGSFQTLNEDWCASVISGVMPFGTDRSVFDMVWSQARDRAYQTTKSEQRTLEAAFSVKGFSLPPGAMVDAIAQSEQRATGAILDVSREQAIKDADIKVELLKHAAQIAAQLKMGLLNSSADFFRAWHQVYQQDAEAARARAAAYSAYYSSLKSYYDVETSWEAMRLEAAKTRSEVGASIDRNRVSMSSASSAASGHGQAVRGFADVAGSASSAAGTLIAQIESV
jgi:hypothetical protein